MITVLPENNDEFLKKLYSEKNIAMNEFSRAVTARDGEEVLGYCLYALKPDSFTVCALEPMDDLALADGILRSALHIAAERSIMKAYYSATAPKEIIEKLGFIKSQEEYLLDIDKLFGGCGCQNNGNKR